MRFSLLGENFISGGKILKVFPPVFKKGKTLEKRGKLLKIGEKIKKMTFLKKYKV